MDFDYLNSKTAATLDEIRVRVAHEVDDEVEDLRLHGNWNLLAAQLAQVGIEEVVPEQKLHVENSGFTTTSGKQTTKRKFGSKIMSLPRGVPGSPPSCDGSHALVGGNTTTARMLR